MSVLCLISGSVFHAAQTKKTKAGAEFVKLTIRVADRTETQYWTALIFDHGLQQAIAHLNEGDALLAQGRPTFEIYRDRDGEPRISRSLVADQIQPLRRAPDKPPAKRSDLRSHTLRSSPAAPPAPFDDSVPF